MPVVQVNMWEEVLNETTEPALIAALTDAICSVVGERARPFTTVMVNGVPQRRWATGGIVVQGMEDHPRLVAGITEMLQPAEASA
ncbi:MAG TPA: hypothetical protein VFB41_06900 [Solirubrobacteraceae bacterium]|nr:hypothetical protein [Solirubrobacteraceae bacterium]